MPATTSNGSKVFMCSICDKHLHSKARLISHTIAHHIIGKKTTAVANNEVENAHEASIQCTFSCPCCAFVGQSETELDVHLSSRCKNYSKYLDKCSSGGDSKVFNCHTCGYKSKSKLAYKKHLEKHGHYRVIQVFFCPHCDYLTSRRTLIGSHILTHTKVKKYKCPYCPYSAIRSDYLQKHVVTHKKDYRPFKCNFCSYTAVRNDYLKRHVAKHTQYPQVKCADCDYRCSRPAELGEHAKIHRNGALYKCTSCDFTSKQKEAIVSHVSTHSEVSAFVCHDDSARLRCQKCDVTFSDELNLSVHQCEADVAPSTDVSGDPVVDPDYSPVSHSITHDSNDMINFISVSDCKGHLVLNDSEKVTMVTDYTIGELTDTITFLDDPKISGDDLVVSAYPISHMSIAKEDIASISANQDGLILNIDF